MRINLTETQRKVLLASLQQSTSTAEVRHLINRLSYDPSDTIGCYWAAVEFATNIFSVVCYIIGLLCIWSYLWEKMPWFTR